MTTWGIISGVDADAITRTLLMLGSRFHGQPLRVCEIGVCHGGTSRAIAEVCASHSIALEFWGVDNGRDQAAGAVCATVPPFPDAFMVIGDSAEVYMDVPEGLHFVFADGAHCLDHVCLDFLNFGDKLVVGGRIAFHDAAPRSQRKCDNQGHGRVDHPDFGTATLEALRKLGLMPMHRDDWMFVEHVYDPTIESAGIAVFERIA